MCPRFWNGFAVFFSFVVRDLNAEPVTMSGVSRMFQNDRGREGGRGGGPAMTEPLRVVFLLLDLEFGGTQRYVIHLLNHLDRSRYQMEVWCLRGADDLDRLVEEAGLPVRHMSEITWGVLPQALVRLVWRLLRRRPHILFTLTAVPNVWGRLCGRLCGVPVLISSFRALRPKQHEKRLWRLSDRVVTNAEAIREVIVREHGVPGERIAVVPNGVDTTWFQPDPGAKARAPTVVYAGRLADDKDPLTLVRGFIRAADMVPEACFEIVGQRPPEKRGPGRDRRAGAGRPHYHAPRRS